MLKKLAACAVLLLAAGCGGGGGAGSLNLSLSPSPLSKTFQQWDGPVSLTFDATVSGPQPPSPFYLLILDTGAMIQPGVPQVSVISDSTAAITLQTANGLPAGSYQASLIVQICSDQACTGTVYAKATLPYKVTVTPNPALTAKPTPATLTRTIYQGDAPSWSVNFAVQGTPADSNGFYVGASDPAGILNLVAANILYGTPQPVTGSSFAANASLAVMPGPGEYKGTVQVHLCRDQACQQLYSGATTLPYDITILPGTNLSTLSPLTGAYDWVTLNGNAAHNAYVPVTVDASKFNSRWVWTAPQAGDRIQPVGLLDPVTSGGIVFVAASGYATSGGTPSADLYAVREQDAGTAWHSTVQSGDSYYNVSAPAYASGNLYMAVSPDSSPYGSRYDISGNFNAYKAGDGSLLFSTPAGGSPAMPEGDINSPAVRTAPTLIGGAMLANYYGPFPNNYFQYQSFDMTSGNPAHIPDCMLQAEQGDPSHDVSSRDLTETAAVDAQNKAYFTSDAGLLVADFGSAQACDMIASSTPPYAGVDTGYNNSVPALVGNGDVLVRSSSSHLDDYDTVHSALKWTVAGSYIGGATAANGVAYIQNSSPFRLEARSEADGSLLWSWTPGGGDSSFCCNIVATRNLVFVSTDQQVYAIDNQTHQAVWFYTHPGRLAISSNGILYIARGVSNSSEFETDGSLAAINLR